jgi:hypothetical protein
MAQFSVSKYSSLYPKNTYYTKGGELSLDGANYIGPFYVVNGKAYTGKPGNPNAKQLTAFYANSDNYAYDKLKGFNVRQKSYKSPKYAITSPSPKDYEIGYFYRYVIVHNLDTTMIPFEIDEPQVNVYGKRGGIDNGLYTVLTIKWMIRGLAFSIRDGVNVKLSVVDANRETIYKYANRYPNIIYTFKNYEEFAQLSF